jgi:hypothetical protein
LGLRFSDYNTPFPTKFRAYDVAGTWTHFDGRGWQPKTTDDGDGPVILIPLVAGAGDFEFTAELDFRYAAVAEKSYTQMGYVDSSNQVGAYGEHRDTDAANVDHQPFLYTHDGDGTYTNRYTGTVHVGATIKKIGIRVISSAISIYDHADQDWNDFQGQPAAAKSGYSPTAVYLQFLKVAGSTLNQVYVRSLRLKYSRRSG